MQQLKIAHWGRYWMLDQPLICQFMTKFNEVSLLIEMLSNTVLFGSIISDEQFWIQVLQKLFLKWRVLEWVTNKGKIFSDALSTTQMYLPYYRENCPKKILGQKNMCVYCHMLKKLGSVGRSEIILFYFYFLLLNLCWMVSRINFYTWRVTFNSSLSK